MLRYVKFSNERGKKYKIETSIWQEHKSTFIIKKALNGEAKRHVRTIYENCKILSKIYGKDHIANCYMLDESTVKIDYIEGISLADKITELLDDGNFNEVNTLIQFYVSKILRGTTVDNDFFLLNPNEENRNTNIDLSFDNIILNGDFYSIIDYEWLYTDVPQKFVLYRAIKGFLERKERYKKNFPIKIFFQKYNIDNNFLYNKKEREFYNEVLEFPHRKYEKNIVNFFRDIDEKKIQERDKYKLLENKYKLLENNYNKIQKSSGYRFLLKYYHLRDRIFPMNSNRRFLFKIILKILNKETYKLINYNNMLEALNLLRYGGIHQFLVRVDSKINNVIIKNNVSEIKDSYLNNNLVYRSILLPENVIIDIVVPIYNAFEYMEKCIETVYENTTINYNLYLINDCSTDEKISLFLRELKQKKYPFCLQKLYIINNQENKGFIKSVNSALKLTKNDVILLNTDTEVPPNWAQRLYLAMYRNNKISSVTPFSNSATICSYPDFCKNNELAQGWSVEQLDKLFEQYGGTKPFDVPTGVGFCMLLNRKCIMEIGVFDTSYGKGYGEENDWCMRARKKGYHNVMVTNLFVYHKHGVSFGEQHDKNRDERIQENLAILNKRYPEYTGLVNNYIRKDPVQKIRKFIKCIQLEKMKPQLQGILFINHSNGGGTKVYQDSLIHKWRYSKRIYTLELLPDCKTILWTVFQDESKKKFYFDLKIMQNDEFKKLIEAFNVKLIYINQLITYPIKKIIKFIKTSECEYIFFLHDFYAVCPGYTLLNEKGIYCNNENREGICNTCLSLSHNLVSKNIKEWRKTFHEFLLGAKKVLAPSTSTAQIVNSYYNDVKIIVKEHEIPPYVHKTFDVTVLNDDRLTITILGAIGENKGAKIIYELATQIRKDKLPIHIKVIGITNLHNEYYKSEDGILEITGPYHNNNVSELLVKYRTAVVLIPSIWPETYSFTASEAIYSGYPIIAFDIGAPAERIRRMGCGWIVRDIKGRGLFKLIADLSSNHNAILDKHKNIKKYLADVGKYI